MKDMAPDTLRRTRIDPEDLPEGAVLIDQTRERTSWEEGMFVTSAQFTRDQSYVIARQADLGQAIGPGVIAGLEVSQPGDNPTALMIEPGLGLGGGGESIVLHAPVTLALADTALQKGLTKTAGLNDSLRLISEARTGLFVLCATPVEYTSNSQAMMATTSGGQRKLADSVVTEATLFTLVPFALGSGAATPQARRSMAARRVFRDGAMAELPPSALPLAMVELDGNVLVWFDMHMVRRTAGAARADAFGLGIVDTPARLAHSAQYETQLAAMVAAAPDQAFQASQRFDILPPMGRMPAACVAERVPAPGLAPVLSHNWLPAEMPVELTALPEDEIAALLDESLTMPPIDLHAGADALAQSPVTVIVPIPRTDWAEAPLEIVQAELTLEAAAPLGKTPSTPMELIHALQEQEIDPDQTDPTDAAPWLALLAGRTTLWYMRRRQFLRTDALTGKAYAFPNGDGPPPDPPEEPDPEVEATLEVVIDAFDEATVSGVEWLGIEEHIREIQAGETLEGQAARARIYTGISSLLRQDSPLAAADLAIRAGAAAPMTEEEALKLLKLYQDPRLRTRFAPYEALLIGGPVEFILPRFEPDEPQPDISRAFARAVNGGIDPEPAPHPKLPDDMRDRAKEVLTELELPDEVVEGILQRGGGPIPMANARDLDKRLEVLKRFAEAALPFHARLAQPGSVETQTRRNLIVRTKLLPDVIKAFADTPAFEDLLDPVKEVMASMDKALERDPDDAIQLVAEALAVFGRT